jgi:hypothetical protein
VFTAAGEAALVGPTDFLRSTNPGVFAPRNNRTLALKFTLQETTLADPQNKEGGAIFATDSSLRPPVVESINGLPVQFEGSLFGVGGAVTVYDRRRGQCLWIGGYAGQGIDIGDYPSRESPTMWQYNKRSYAQRLQAYDGQNFWEIYSRGSSPLPRSQPVVAYNPIRDTVMLFGGLTQDNPQKVAADTWEWDGSSWTRLSAGPATDQFAANELGRYGGNVMALDPFRNQMVMVGGRYAVQDGGTTNNQLQSQVTTTGRTAGTWQSRWNDVRRTSMHHFVTDPATGASDWQATVTLPSTFPSGYPAALVAVPEGTAKGLYYISFRQTVCWNCGTTANDVWWYNGVAWQPIVGSALPDNQASSFLYAAYEPVKKTILVTMGNGNDSLAKRVWEFNPQTQTWRTVYRNIGSAPVTFGNMPCFNPVRRELVEYGGVPSSWNSNYDTRVRERVPQDVLIYSTASESWSRSPVQYDRSSSYGHSFGLFAKLGGVFTQGGQTFRGWLGAWEEHTNGFVSWLFKDGFWQRMLNTDVAKKMNWWNPGSPSLAAYLRPTVLNANTATESLAVVEASNFNDATAATGKGRPKTLRLFDGTGWNPPNGTPSNGGPANIDSSDITFPQERCSTQAAASLANNTNPPEYWSLYPHNQAGFSRLSVPWGGGSVLMKGPGFSSFTVYENGQAATPNCTSTSKSWRYADSPFLFLRQESGNWKTRELKQFSQALLADPFKFCSTVGDGTPNNPDVASVFKRNPVQMVWDAPRNRVLLVAYDDYTNGTPTTIFPKTMQALRWVSGTSSGCVAVDNVTTVFPVSTMTQIGTRSDRYDRALHDTGRNKLLLLSNGDTTNTCSTGCGGNPDGFIWEFDLATATWTQRMLPQPYLRLTAFHGGFIFHASEYPGSTNEWFLHATHEHGSYNRPMAEDYILKVTDTEITLRPSLPRFGVTLGADGRSGYISVPGDKGEPMPNTVGGQTVYSGRRKFANDLVGTQTLFITFNSNSTYSVYLNDTNNPVLSNITWAGTTAGLYLNDFVLGARNAVWSHVGWGSIARWIGAGNTNTSFDWLKVFDKALTSEEIAYWSTRLPEEQ